MLSNNKDLLNNYSKSRQNFVEASGQFQNILNNLGVVPTTIHVGPGVQLANVINPSYVVEPHEAAVSGAKFLSSTEQLKTGSQSVIAYINSL